MRRTLPSRKSSGDFRHVQRSSWFFFFALLFCSLSAPAQVDLQVTEIFSGQEGTDLTADWFEIKNVGNAAWVSGVDPDLYYDDDSASPGDADLIQGITDIQPGEYVIVLVTGDVSDVSTFFSVWSPVINLSSIQIGYTNGAGLGGGGDVVNIWLGDPNASSPVDKEAYPNTTPFDGQSYDVELGAFSTVGNASGAVQTLARAGTTGNVPNIGSPGNQGTIIADPNVPAILGDSAGAAPYLNIRTIGPSFISSDIGDPTDPVATLGIPLILTDEDTPLEDLILTATSENQLVVPDANLTISGTGSNRLLTIAGAGIGFTTITVTVTDSGGNSGTYKLDLAVSNAAIDPATTRFHAGSSDGSTAQATGSDYMWVADDENQTIRLFNRRQSGLPAYAMDFNAALGSGGEIDMEGSFRNGNTLFWMGSHTTQQRSVIFSTTESGSGAEMRLTFSGHYRTLLQDLIGWDNNNGHGLGTGYYGFGTGVEIEGLSADPNNPNGALLGFRSPLVNGKALIVPVTNFQTIVAASPTPNSAVFGDPIELDLEGHSIRSIECDANGCLIVAGPFGTVTDFRLFTWSGNPADTPELRAADLDARTNNSAFEGIVALPAGPFLGSEGDTVTVQFLVDTGTFDYYNSGTEAKDLPNPEWKKFRSELVTLGPVETPPVANPGDVVITEIMQNPNVVTDANGEWFELYNNTAASIDLNGWTIADVDLDTIVIDHGGPLIIPSGGYLVLGVNADPATNGGVIVDYAYSSGLFSLGNGADELILIAPDGVEVDRVEWDGGPLFPDPTGASMSLRAVNLDNNTGTNWCVAATPYGAGDFGTPGAANDCPPPPVANLQITEVWVGQDGDDLTADWFEITNFGEVAWVSGVDGDLYYDDDSQDPAAADLISGITDIRPGESVIVMVDAASAVNTFRTVWEPVYNLTGVKTGWTDGAGLGQGGDAVTLFVGIPSGETVADYEAFPAIPSGVSYDFVLGDFSREGAGMVQPGTNIAVATIATAGSTGTEPAIGSPGNKGPLFVPAYTLQITEIFSGQAGDDLTADWFEVKNTGNAPWVAGVDPVLYYDDDSADPDLAVPIQGLTEIRTGTSVIVLVTGDTADITKFVNVWSPVIDLTGVEIGYADGAGLGGGGDVVTLWLGDPGLSNPIDTASYPDTAPFDGQSYDVELQAFSVEGNANGAVKTNALGGTAMNVPNIGSPGNKGPVSGLKDRPVAGALQVFPNPSLGWVTIRPAGLGWIEHAEVYDLTGKLVFSVSIGTADPFEVDLSKLPASVYYLMVRGEKGIGVERIVKK